MSKYSTNTKYDDLIRSYHVKYPNISSKKELARVIIEEERLDLSHGHFAQVVQSFFRRNDELEITGDADDTGIAPRWEVLDDKYHIHAKRGEIRISVEEIDELFYEYSRHGLDMSQMQIRQKHDIEVWQWHAIKSALWLYKEANIFSPYTVDNTPDDELQELIREKMEMKFDDKRLLIEQEYDEVQRKNFNKAIKESNQRFYAFEKMRDELYDLLPKVKFRDVKRSKDAQGPKDLVAVVSDLHIGAETRDLRITPDFSPDIIKDMLSKAAEEVNSKNAERVHLFILGDIIQTFTGLNHKNSWKSIANGMWGSKVVINALEILEGFIGDVVNASSVYGISGNHDRTTSDKKEDDKGEIAELLFYMLERVYGQVIDVQHDALILSRNIGKVNYLLAHGDHGVPNKDPKTTVLNYGRYDMFNLILSGHLHHREIPEDHKNFRWIKCPSMYSGGWYEEKNSWSALPGMLLIDSDRKLPVISDVPIILD